MLIRFFEITRAIGLASLVFTAAACSSVNSSGYGTNTGAQANIPVIVMLEDSSPSSIVRSSDINKRVSASLKDSMFRHGFRMIDEDMIASRLGWNIGDRRPKSELMKMANLANSSGQANLQSRALALYRIHGHLTVLTFGTKVETRVDGELYDLDNNTLLGTFELPVQQYPAPTNCNAACISEIIGAKASDMALSIGDVLGSKLNYLSPRSTSQTFGNQTTGSRNTATQQVDPRCQNLVSAYTMTFRRFEQTEINSIMNTITNNRFGISDADRFPCFMSSDLMDSKPGLSRYSYTSTATKGKLKSWVDQILVDAGFTPNRDVAVLLTGNDLTLDKLITRTPPMDRVPSGSKFN
jgi:hypothetical protein